MLGSYSIFVNRYILVLTYHNQTLFSEDGDGASWQTLYTGGSLKQENFFFKYNWNTKIGLGWLTNSVLRLKTFNWLWFLKVKKLRWQSPHILLWLSPYVPSHPIFSYYFLVPKHTKIILGRLPNSALRLKISIQFNSPKY